MTETNNRFKCEWCGKEFVAKSRHSKRFCSEECHKAILRAYNTQYQRDKRAKMTNEELEPNRQTARKSWALRSWEAWGTETDKILALAKSKDPKSAITKYLHDTFRHRSARQTPPDLTSISEAKVADRIIAKTLGN